MPSGVWRPHSDISAAKINQSSQSRNRITYIPCEPASQFDVCGSQHVTWSINQKQRHNYDPWSHKSIERIRNNVGYLCCDFSYFKFQTSSEQRFRRDLPGARLRLELYSMSAPGKMRCFIMMIVTLDAAKSSPIFPNSCSPVTEQRTFKHSNKIIALFRQCTTTHEWMKPREYL